MESDTAACKYAELPTREMSARHSGALPIAATFGWDGRARSGEPPLLGTDPYQSTSTLYCRRIVSGI